MYSVTHGAFVSIRGLLALVLGLCIMVWGYPTVAAAPAYQVTVDGRITDVAFSAMAGDPQFIKVNDVIIQLPPGFSTVQLEIGTGVRVTGQFRGDTLIASQVTITSNPPPEPSIADSDDDDSDDDDDNGNGDDDNDNGGGDDDDNDNGGGDDNDNNDDGGDNDNG